MIRERLRRWPRLYRFLQRAWYGSWYGVERFLLGSRIHELAWRVRGADKTATAPDHPRRAFLVDRVRRLGPPGSVLEVGCGSGHNLVALSLALPGVELRGVDISPRAIRAAVDLLAANGLRHVPVEVAGADNLWRVPDASADLVLSYAALMYVGPDKIERALREAVRVARRGVMLHEWHVFERNGGPPSRWLDGHWIHDYEVLLRPIPRVAAVRVERQPSALWGPGAWQEYGALVEVDVR